MNAESVQAVPISKLSKPFQAVSSATFFFYIFFLIEFFLHLSQRIPGIGVIRPTLILIVVLILLLWSQKNILAMRQKNKITSALTVLMLYILLTIPFVTFPGSVIKVNIPFFVKSVVFFFFTVAAVDTQARFKIMLIVFIGCQLFRVLEPLYLNITTGYWGSSTYMGGSEFAYRLAGAPNDVINPNELGFVIATIIPFIHYLLLPRGWFKKILYVGLMAALLYALILTMSRGAFLALLVVAFMVFRESKSKFLLILLGFTIAVSGWSVMTPIQKDRYLSLVSSDAEASAGVEGRFKGMEREFILGMRRPIFGHGLGTTPEAKYNFTGHRQASHNLYAELLIEIGLVGMFLFLRYLRSIYIEIATLKNRLSPRNIESQRMVKVALCVFIMYAVYSVNYWGLSQSYWYFFGGMVAALAHLINRSSDLDLYEEVAKR